MMCPDHDVLIALGDGELEERRARDVRAHTDGCTRCRAQLADLATITSDLRAPPPGALDGRTPEAFADEVLANLDRTRARTRESRLPRWIGLLAAAAALPLAVALSRHYSSDTSEWTARGALASSEAMKHTLVQFGRVSGTSFEPLVDGARLEADALVAAEIGGTEGPSRYLLAFLVDAAGDRHWIYPAYEPGTPPPSAIALPVATTPRVLGSMVRLDRPAPGPAQLVAIVLPRSESVDHVEHAPPNALTREQLARHYGGALVVITRVEVQ